MGHAKEFVKIIVESLTKGAPRAVLIAIVGAFWQAIYIYSRDRLHDKRAASQASLEEKKFSHQQKIEEMRFEYEQRRWREELGTQLVLKHVDTRSCSYASLWSLVREIAISEEITPESAKKLATKIKDWRYSVGGLLAEETTRDAAYRLQQALWTFDGMATAYNRIRSARGLLRAALRADMGLGEDIFKIATERQRIREELKSL